MPSALTLQATKNQTTTYIPALTHDLQGMGWQKIGSYINIVGQLLVGLPCALILAFGLGLGVEGLVTGKP